MREYLRRSIRPIASAAAVGLFVLCGSGVVSAPPIDSLAFATTNQRPCGATPLCAADPAPDAGDQASAEQQVIDGYVKKQVGCTPDLAPSPRSITWDPPGFTPNVGGSGNINDADPRLGGHFAADYVNGHWHVAYMYC